MSSTGPDAATVDTPERGDAPDTAVGDQVTALRERVQEVGLRDRFELGRRLDRIVGTRAGTTSKGRPRRGGRRGRGGPDRNTPSSTDSLDAIETDLVTAEAHLTRRRERLPRPSFPPSLPITERVPELCDTIRDHQVVIVAGETGSGKSTQLPKICLALGRGARGLIGHTQPRRLAARTVAERVAAELDSEVGGPVGYAVRFTDTVSDDSFVKLMTDGILLAEIQRDRMLRSYDTIIVDEAHERSLNIDFILGYLKALLPRRPDLKVIVTSATIDTERFSKHFGDAPIVEVSGRTFPVELRYRPLDGPSAGDAEESGEPATGDRRHGRDQAEGIADAVRELIGEGPGDILVFLSGEREIRDTADELRGRKFEDTEILPLYARLSSAEQHRVFEPHTGRRVVLATNVAETSLTVPGVRYVVDPGTARISRYNRRTKVQRLPIEPVSQASANQRAGRCGRVAPGVCIRLFSEEDFDLRPEFTEPEILRTNLASVILQMASLRLGDIAAFPFVEPPEHRAIRDGVTLLEELGALDPTKAGTNKWLTPRGRQLAKLPIDPRLGRMVLESANHGCAREVILIAAALSIQDPRERPTGKTEAANEFHRRFANPRSDLIAWLDLWDYLREQQRALSGNQFRRRCRSEYLNFLRIREWQDIDRQLRQVARTIGIEVNRHEATEDAIHRSVLAGLLSHLGMRSSDKQEYQGARNSRFVLARDSALAKKPPQWVMAAELVETNRIWARGAARIEPEWAEALAPHLVKRTHGDPLWEIERGGAIVDERVTLYGLPIVAKRTVDLASVDPARAREIFLRQGLLGGHWVTDAEFAVHNRQLLGQVRALENRARRPLLSDQEELYAFYDERIDAEVTNGRQFDKWWRTQRRREPKRLHATLALLVPESRQGVKLSDYPNEWRQGDLSFALSYDFDPGSDTDGVTVHIPLPLLNQVTEDGFDWQVPGLREELVTELVRTLPKEIRRELVPAPDRARAFLADPDNTPAAGSLLAQLSRELGAAARVRIPLDAWRPGDLPGHLRVTYRAVDEAGKGLAKSKSLAALQAHLEGRLRATIAEATREVERTGLTSWSIVSLPSVLSAGGAGDGRGAVKGYPALTDEGTTVGVRVLSSPEEQASSMWVGTRRMLRLTVPSFGRDLRRIIERRAGLSTRRAPHGSLDLLVDDATDAVIDRLLAAHGGPVWNGDDFDRLRRAVRSGLPETVNEVATAAATILCRLDEIERRLSDATAPVLQFAVGDIRVQLDTLVPPDFITTTGAHRLADLDRYLHAIVRRLDKVGQSPDKDRRLAQPIRQLEADHRDLLDALGPHVSPAAALAISWQIQELRVSQFAQVLGTPSPVSEKRIRKAMNDLR